MIKVKQIYDMIQEYAPNELAYSGDNVGLLVGDFDAEVTGVVLALDMDIECVDMARAEGANLIITHHPVIFSPLTSIVCDDPTGRVIYHAINAGMNVISAHTNLDAATGGITETLSSIVGLQDIRQANDCNVMRVGELTSAMTLPDFVSHLKNTLKIDRVDVTRHQVQSVLKVAVVSGRGCSMLREAKETGADVFLLGEIKHENTIYANILGLCVISCGHHETEVLILDNIKMYLQNKLDGVQLNLDVYNQTPMVKF